MKKIISVLFLFLGFALAQFPPLSPYHQFNYFGFEHRLEANGVATTYGAKFKTAIALDAGRVKRGDSSVVAFILGAHGPINCDNPLDTIGCQRHRAYLIQRFRGHKVSPTADTSKTTGVRLQGPYWTDFWYKSTIVLRNAPFYDWESPATWLDDSSDAGGGQRGGPVTIARDSAGYMSFGHTPTFDLADRTYQVSLANDPTGALQAKPNRWNHIQVYIDADSAKGFGICWVNGKVHSRANIIGFNGTLAQFHAGLYASPAVASGTVWNDDLFLVHVRDTNEAIHKYLDPVP